MRASPIRRSPMRRRYRSTGTTKAIREALIIRDGGCVLCGEYTSDLEPQHRKPRKMGGRADKKESNSLSNLITLCADDHRWVESRREESYDQGWLVLEAADPRWTPVRHFLYGLVYLLPDGTVQPVPRLDEAS